MISNVFAEMCDPSNFDSITVKVEHPEYGPMDASATVAQLSNMRFHEPQPIVDINNYTDPPFRNEIYQKMEQIIGEDSVIDFIENSIDKFLVGYSKDKIPQSDKLRKGAERQRIYRQNESDTQRERRLEMARQYIKKKRQNESHDQRYDRLKKQRDRIRAIRDAMKLNPDIYKMRKHIEAERMKVRRANETASQRMKRLEKSRVYSKKRRENEVYRILENEKNRIAHQYKRSDENFRLQERQRDRVRKKFKRDMTSESQDFSEPILNIHNNLNIIDPHHDIPGPLPPIPVPIVPCSLINN